MTADGFQQQHSGPGGCPCWQTARRHGWLQSSPPCSFSAQVLPRKKSQQKLVWEGSAQLCTVLFQPSGPGGKEGFPHLVPELFCFARAAWLFLRAMLSPCSPTSQVSAVPAGLLLSKTSIQGLGRTPIYVVLGVNEDDVATKVFVFQQVLPNVSSRLVILLQVGEGGNGEWVGLGECALARRRWAEAKIGCCRVSSDVSYAPKQ